jgi:hypothetical protein
MAFETASFSSSSLMIESHMSLFEARFDALPRMNKPSFAREMATVTEDAMSSHFNIKKKYQKPFVRLRDWYRQSFVIESSTKFTEADLEEPDPAITFSFCARVSYERQDDDLMFNQR